MENKSTIDIGAYGAIRPLKNQLLQALAAIKFAESIGKTLRFHINITRIENNGDPVLKNLRNLFSNSDHVLIEHPWMNHHEFLKVVKTMDICMQVSFSETFNIVTADAVNMNVPVVTSDEIGWVFRLFRAQPTSSKSILRKLKIAWITKCIGLQWVNKFLLYMYSLKSESVWLAHFSEDICTECICGLGIDCICKPEE